MYSWEKLSAEGCKVEGIDLDFFEKMENDDPVMAANYKS
jgi:hypothetical protein